MTTDGREGAEVGVAEWRGWPAHHARKNVLRRAHAHLLGRGCHAGHGLAILVDAREVAHHEHFGMCREAQVWQHANSSRAVERCTELFAERRRGDTRGPED